MSDSASALRVGSRKSPLARRQAESVMAWIAARHPQCALSWSGIATQGDRQLDRPLATLARETLTKGVFVRELENALLAGEIDVAVHSLKDMPGDLPPGLALQSAGEREDPCDALVSITGLSLSQLPAGARLGTSSVRREAMLRALRPDVACYSVRGNLQTRLAKLESGEYDALILAAAGLRRLGEEARIVQRFDPLVELTPPCGQGILAVEYRQNDARTRALLASIAVPAVETAMQAERAALCALQAGCSAALGAYAAPEPDGDFTLSLWFLPPETSMPLMARARFQPVDAARTAHALALRLQATAPAP
ncbi:MAG: hydroxymethylbilane synthase [Vampirovibrionales bacterium]|nr:hydroxymethylbilane synthase [Vampirovibrionales bacterium]